MRIVLICGMPGSGKTALAQDLVQRHRRRGRRWVAWDLIGDWSPAPDVTVCRDPDPEVAAAEAIRQSPSILIADEAHLAFPHHGPDRGGALWEIVHVGRHPSAEGRWARRGPVAMIAMTQLPGSCWNRLRFFVSVLYVCSMPAGAEKDLAWLAAATQDPDLPRKAVALPMPDPERGIGVRFLRYVLRP